MPYEKGECGNPAGRPLGSRNRATLLMESLMADDAEAIGRKAIEMAKGGDLAAIRLCLDRLAPTRKGKPVPFELPPLEKPADSVAAAAKIAAGVASGELTPSEAAELAKVVEFTCGRSRPKSSMSASPKWRTRLAMRPAAPVETSVAMPPAGCSNRGVIVLRLFFTMKIPTGACGGGAEGESPGQ